MSDISNTKDLDNKKEYEFFDRAVGEMNRDIADTEENIEYRKQTIKAQKKYVRDSHGDMDDHEFLQNMNSINTDVMFIDNAQKKLDKLKHHVRNPYFGKVVFRFRDGEQIPVYVGMNGYWSKDIDDQLIYDWRSPVASMYYDYEKGAAGYDAPDGHIDGEIVEKKQFDIKNGTLKSVADTDYNVSDNLLIHALAENSGTRMRSVVATIQKEQNGIIRNNSAYNLIVDGKAGSGKTVVAMHRLAWLMYTHRKTIKADNVMIMSPNGIFGDYISSVLPEIGEDNVPEKEFDSLMEEILFINEPFENKLAQSDVIIDSKYDGGELIYDPDTGDGEDTANRILNIKLKSSVWFFDKLNEYIEEYINNFRFRDFHFEKTTFPEAKLSKMFKERFARDPYYERFGKIAYFVAEQLEDEQGRAFNTSKRAKVEKQITGELIHQYGRYDLVEIYRGFLDTIKDKYPYVCQYTNEYGEIRYEDVLVIFYMQVLFYGCHSYDEIKHLVIDEMQDYNIFQYAVISHVFKCRKTILGDIYQVLFYNPGETVVDVLKKVFAGEGYEVCQLNTAYRSTKEITEFCDKILAGEDCVRPESGKMVARSGKVPEVSDIGDMDELIMYITDKDLDAYDNVAVLVDDEAQAFRVSRELEAEGLYVTLLTHQSSVYSGGLVVLPKFLAKGMEFDAVFVVNCGHENTHSYYISCTRALHELYVCNMTGEL